MNGPLKKAVREMLLDKSFKFNSPIACNVQITAEVVNNWIKARDNHKESEKSWCHFIVVSWNHKIREK